MLPIEKICAEHGPSMGVVIQACRVFFGSTDIKNLNNLLKKDEHNWKHVAGLTRQHRIRPIVFRMLLECQLPEPIRKAIDTELRILLRDELIRTSETLQIAELLQSKGMNALPYKGATFSKEFFGEFGMRETGDIDLAIDKWQLETIDLILKDRNYKPIDEDFYEYLGHKAYYKRNRGYNYIKSKETITFFIENHWGMLEDFNLVTDTTNTFTLSEKKILDGNDDTIFTLNKFEHFKATFLHHTIQEGLTYLKTIIDLAQALKVLGEPKSTFEKSIISQLSKNHRLEEITHLINLLFGTTTSTIKVNKKNVDKLIRLPFLAKLKVVEDKENYSFLDYVKYHTNLLRARIFFVRGLITKIKFLMKAIQRIFKYDIEDFRWIKIPKRFVWLYHLIRPIRKIFFPTNPLSRLPQDN